MLYRSCALLLALCLAPAAAAPATDREDYNRRAALADAEAFRALDLDADGRLTLEEVRPDLHFGPRFDDADINRDGVLTGQEMQAYLVRQYGPQGEMAAARLGGRSAAGPTAPAK